MYHRARINKEYKAPFEIRCANCGSHNVTIVAFEYKDLELKCRSCGSCVDDVGTYNEMNYVNYVKASRY